MRFSIRLVDRLYQQIATVAADKGVSRNAVIVEALWRYVEEARK